MPSFPCHPCRLFEFELTLKLTQIHSLHKNPTDPTCAMSLLKKNKLTDELSAQLKRRIKKAETSGKLDVSTTPNCQFNFKFVPSLIYSTFGRKEAAPTTTTTTTTDTTTTTTTTPVDQKTSLPTSVDLQELWLSNNTITVLTRELYSLPQLRVLCLSDNHLTAVPSSIGTIVTLQRLILNGNKITSIPADIMKCQELIELRLDNNRLSEFPLCLTELKNLVRLGLSQNKIGPSIPAQVRKLRQLIELDLDGNALTTLPNSLSHLNPSLQQLGLSSNRFSTIPTCVDALSNLDVLRLEGNRVHVAINEETKAEETQYHIPTRHDGYPELRTGAVKLPGYLEESVIYNRMNANWLRNDGEKIQVDEVTLLRNRALRKKQRIKSEEGQIKGGNVEAKQQSDVLVSEQSMTEVKGMMMQTLKKGSFRK